MKQEPYIKTRRAGYCASDEKCANCCWCQDHPTRARGCDNTCETTVIKTVSLRGAGTQNDLCHLVAEYWTKDGKKIGEIVIS